MDTQPNNISSDNEDTYSETAADTTPLRSEQTGPDGETNSVTPPATPPQALPATPASSDEETPVTPTPLASVVTPPPKPSKKKWFIFGGIAAAIILIVAAVLVYFLWYQKPEKVLGDAVGQLVTAKNMTFTGSLSTGSDTNTVALTYNGAVNGQKSEATMTATVNASGEKFSVPVSVSGDPQQVYFKLSGLEDLEKKFVTPYLSMFGATAAQQAQVDTLVKDIDGQWYRATPEDLSGGNASKSKSSCIGDQIEKIRTDKATQNELTTIYKAHPLFIITKSLGTKDGSVGYQVEPVSDHDAKPFFAALSNSKYFKDLQKCDSSIKIDLSDFDDKTSDASKATITVWANQWNHQLTSLSFDSNDASSPAKLVFTPKIGAVKSIETPKNAKSIDELKNDFQQLMTTMMGGAATSGI